MVKIWGQCVKIFFDIQGELKRIKCRVIIYKGSKARLTNGDILGSTKIFFHKENKENYYKNILSYPKRIKGN